MSVFSYKNIEPKIGNNCFVAPGAAIIGNVTIGNNVSFWFNTVARGDVNKIIIGDNSNIQDLTMLHVTDDFPLIIGKEVTVGHNAILHGCNIGDNTLIGMGAIVLDNASLGSNSVLAAGSLLPPGKVYPSNVLIMGNPGKVVRELLPEEIESIKDSSVHYQQRNQEYLNSKEFFKI